MTESKRNLLATALLIALIFAVFADVLFFGRCFFFRDITRFYYPTKRLVHDIVWSGEFPFWNPYNGSGQPLAANPDYGVFYPGQWLIFLPGFDFWFRFHFVLHFCIAASGVFFLLRRHTARIESALFGAIVYALGGLMVGMTNLLPIFYPVAWLPWILWAIDRERIALTAIFIALAMAGADPVTIAEVCLIAVVASALRRRLWQTLLAIVGAVFIAAVQLVPAADLLHDSSRADGFPFEVVAKWSTPPLRLLDLLIPQFSGTGTEHFRFYWGTAKYGWLDPFYPGIYFGLIPIALALAAMNRRVLVALLVSFVLAIGVHTPLLRLMYDAHLFRSFRYPEKFLLLGLIPLMLYSAIAFDRALADWRIAKRAAVIAGAVAIVCLALEFVSPQQFINFWDIGISPFAAQMAALSRGVWLRAAITAIVSAAVLLLGKHPRWAWLAIAVTIADLAIQRPSIAETVDGDFFRSPPAAVRSLAPAVRLFHQAEWYSATVIARQYFDLPQMYWVVRNGLFPSVGARWGVAAAMNSDIDRTFLRPAAEFNQTMLELRDRRIPRWFEPMMAMSAAGYRALYLPFEQQLARAAADPASIQPIIFVPVKTNPILYFADRIVRCRTHEEFVSAVVANRFAMTTAYADVAPFAPAPARVIDSKVQFNSAEVHVESTGNALLVCSITRHKYWSATIDDRAATLLPVNIQYQALVISAGKHTVRLRYFNPLLVVCAVISLISFAVALAAAMLPLRRK